MRLLRRSGPLMRELRSELVRLRRGSVILGWFGLVALASLMVNVVMFQVVGDPRSGTPANGPGVSFPTVAELESPEGVVAGLTSATSLFGVITLAYWAITAAVDFSTGLIRLHVAAQPRRWRLLAGKTAALMLYTAAAALLALVLTILIAPVGAGRAGIDTATWSSDSIGVAARAYLDVVLALLVWGTVGLALGVLTRSAALATSVGIGYVLVIESVLRAASERIGDWLPGSTITAIAQGGTEALAYSGALALGALYVILGLGVAGIAMHRRDVTD